jgi:hypothetical protein
MDRFAEINHSLFTPYFALEFLNFEESLASLSSLGYLPLLTLNSLNQIYRFPQLSLIVPTLFSLECLQFEKSLAIFIVLKLHRILFKRTIRLFNKKLEKGSFLGVINVSTLF